MELTAVDHVGLQTTVTSAAITVDNSPPILPPALSLEARYVESEDASHQVVLEYTGVTDPESGIVETICSLGSASVGPYRTLTMDSCSFYCIQGTDDLAAGVVSTGAQCVVSLRQPSNHYVYATVTAINGAGLSSTMSSVSYQGCYHSSPLILAHTYRPFSCLGFLLPRVDPSPLPISPALSSLPPPSITSACSGLALS